MDTDQLTDLGISAAFLLVFILIVATMGYFFGGWAAFATFIALIVLIIISAVKWLSIPSNYR